MRGKVCQGEGVPFLGTAPFDFAQGRLRPSPTRRGMPHGAVFFPWAALRLARTSGIIRKACPACPELPSTSLTLRSGRTGGQDERREKLLGVSNAKDTGATTELMEGDRGWNALP